MMIPTIWNRAVIRRRQKLPNPLKQRNKAKSTPALPPSKPPVLPVRPCRKPKLIPKRPLPRPSLTTLPAITGPRQCRTTPILIRTPITANRRLYPLRRPIPSSLLILSSRSIPSQMPNPNINRKGWPLQQWCWVSAPLSWEAWSAPF